MSLGILGVKGRNINASLTIICQIIDGGFDPPCGAVSDGGFSDFIALSGNRAFIGNAQDHLAGIIEFFHRHAACVIKGGIVI